MNEIWKTIEGFEGQYEVSNLGRVRSFWFGKTKILKPGKSGSGYLQVHLSKNGEIKNFYVHRLVAEAFIANPLDLPCVNHLDEDKTNNHVSNLEFCTSKYNQNYGSCRKRIAAKLANGHGAKPVLQFDKQNHFIKRWPSMREAERQTGFNSVGIFYCCNGRFKSYKDYVWRYA